MGWNIFPVYFPIWSYSPNSICQFSQRSPSHSTSPFRIEKQVIEGMEHDAALHCPAALRQSKVWEIHNTNQKRDFWVSLKAWLTRMPMDVVYSRIRPKEDQGNTEFI